MRRAAHTIHLRNKHHDLLQIWMLSEEKWVSVYCGCYDPSEQSWDRSKVEQSSNALAILKTRASLRLINPVVRLLP